MISVTTSCSNEPDASTTKYDDSITGESGFPKAPNYEAMDSRSVEAIVNFDDPFMEAVAKYWDDEHFSNAAVSPLSAACVVCMIANGASDEGRDVVLKTFGLSGSDLETLNVTDIVVHRTQYAEIQIADIQRSLGA